jgi:hypothetical protein
MPTFRVRIKHQSSYYRCGSPSRRDELPRTPLRAGETYVIQSGQILMARRILSRAKTESRYLKNRNKTIFFSLAPKDLSTLCWHHNCPVAISE